MSTTSSWSPAKLAYAFYGTAAGGAVVGQVWVAVEHIPWPDTMPAVARIAVVLPFAVVLELLAMVLAAMGDERQRMGEQAIGFRVFSAAVAVLAVGIIVAGHRHDLYLVAAFGGLSASAYVLWLLHSAARRRDALREAGLLDVTVPVYGLWRRVRHPVLCARAAELARGRGLGLHESLSAAEVELRAERRRPAIAAAVEAAVRAEHPDPRMAQIAVTTLDLDRIAAELEARADYAGWGVRLAAAVTAPDTTPDTAAATGPDMSTDTTPDNGRPRQRPPSRTRKRTTAADKVARAAARRPDATPGELAQLAGVSDRTVRRVVNGSRPDPQLVEGVVGDG